MPVTIRKTFPAKSSIHVLYFVWNVIKSQSVLEMDIILVYKFHESRCGRDLTVHSCTLTVLQCNSSTSLHHIHRLYSFVPSSHSYHPLDISQKAKLHNWRFCWNIFIILTVMNKYLDSACCETFCVFNWLSGLQLCFPIQNLFVLTYIITLTVLTIISDTQCIIFFFHVLTFYRFSTTFFPHPLKHI